MNLSDLLSKVSGQFGKSLILGAFVPVLLFSLLLALAVGPMLPRTLVLFALLEELLGKDWRLIAIAILTVLLSLVLYLGNTTIIRVFEGYPWIGTPWGRWWVAVYTDRFHAVLGRWEVYLALQKRPHELQPRELQAGIAPWAVRTGEQLARCYPTRRDLILPTALGNVIRSFEFYADRQYGIDPIEGWTRLIAKVDKEYAAAIDDAKTGFDFLLNLSVLSAAWAVIAAAAGIASGVPYSSPGVDLVWYAEIAAAAVIAWRTYVGSVGAAMSWGSLVKGAFDLYRWDLLKQLGFTEAPRTLEEERALWDQITRRYVYVESWRMQPLVYRCPAATGIQEDSPPVYLPVLRGMQADPASVGDPTSSFTVTLAVSHPSQDPSAARITGVTVRDNVPEGFTYAWNSALIVQLDGVGNQRIRVTGANPYEFHIGDLAPGMTRVIRYRILKLPT